MSLSVHQELLQESLIGCGNVETCCLIRPKKCSVKAASVGFEPTTDMLQALIDAFNNPSHAREKGIHFNGAKYDCVRADTKSIYGKKEGGSGFVAIQTNQFIIYGSYSSSMFPSISVEAIESLGLCKTSFKKLLQKKRQVMM